MGNRKVLLNNIIKGGFGTSAQIKKGQYLTIIDLNGSQIVDLIAFVADDLSKFMSVSHTRSTYDKYDLKVGDYMFSSDHEPMMLIVEDSYGVHDMSFPSCNKHMYEKMGIAGHRSCLSNFIESLSDYGIEEWFMPDPFHFFQNSPNMQLISNHSKPGDYVTLQFMMDSVIAVSACPYDIDGVNGGKPTSIQMIIAEE